MKLQYLIRNKEDFHQILDYISAVDVFAIDTETNGKFSQFELGLVGISLGFDDFSCYIPLAHYENDQLEIHYVLSKLRPILQDKNSRYVCHNVKFDEKVFQVYGINCQGSGDDTYILSWLLNENTAHGLKPLVKEYLGIQMETYEDVISKQPKRRGVSRDYNFARVPIKDALSYAADDAFYTLRLFRLFEERIRSEGLWNAYARVERPLARVLRDMEYKGVLVNRDALDHAAKRYPEIMEGLEASIYEAAGEVFNLNSPLQVGRMLFGKLQIGKHHVPRTQSGNYATDKKTLQMYASKHEIVEDVLRHKKIKKTYDVFVKGLYPHIHKDGRIHPSFNAQGTVTGRFSANSPNVQQIQSEEVEEIKVRDFFIPSEGNVFIIGDFGQIELRCMAHFARDEVAIEAFKSGRDFHTETAKQMYKIDEPSARQRFFAKSLNFGIPYGRGPMSVAEQLQLEIKCEDGSCGECGQCYISKWFSAFPRVRPFKDSLIKKTREVGYIRTLSGRKRRLPLIRSSDNKIRFSVERQAFNTLHQGSAADIIKLAMVQVEPKLRALNAYILIQVHDELLVEGPKENAEKIVEVLGETMEHPLNGKNPLRLPLKFKPKVAERWSEK